jgi:DNA-binding LytR/AlgR family response regulator
MLNIAIVEDCESDLEALNTVLNECIIETGIFAKIYPFSSGEDFLKSSYSLYDLIFMDIELGSKNGIETAAYLREKNIEVPIVLVTNMMQYAISGYSIHALDYILKPIEKESFKEKFSGWIKIIKQKKKEIIFTTGNGFRKEKISDIYYLEVFGHNLSVHTKKDTFTVRSSLKKIEDELSNSGFVKCNKCYLVNLDHVTNISENMVEVGGDWLTISRREKKNFINAFTGKIGM